MYRPSSPRPNIYGTNPQFTLLNKVSPMIPMYDQDLYALRRRDPSIVSTLARFSRVTCYHDGEQREKQGLEGRMLLYERWVCPFPSCLPLEFSYMSSFHETGSF